MKKSQRRRGMSLIEIMVALGVIAVALFGILTMITHTVREKEAQRELALAKEAVQKKIDELKGQPWASIQAIPPAAPYAPFTVEGLTYPLTADKNGQGWCMIIPQTFPVDPNLVQVEVRVQWVGSWGGVQNDIPFGAPYNFFTGQFMNFGQSVNRWNSYALRCILTP